MAVLPPREKLVIASVGFAWALLVLAWTSAAEHPTSRPSIQTQFSDLASGDVGAREAARVGLMRLTREDLPVLRAVVQTARPLRPAQSAVLRQIVQEIYLSSEQYKRESHGGFLGVMMSGTMTVQADLVPDNDLPAAVGVIVSERIPGFCAARRLMDGDVILGTASPWRLFRTDQDLKSTIGSMGAGTTVRLLVLRRGQVMEVSLTLDAEPAEVTPELRDAFRSKRRRKFDEYWTREFEPLLRANVG